MNRSRVWMMGIVLGCSGDSRDASEGTLVVVSETSEPGGGGSKGNADDAPDDDDDGTPKPGDDDETTGGDPGGTTDPGGAEGESSGGEPAWPPDGHCFEDAPDGAPSPPSPPGYSGGSCPEIEPGWNTGFTAGGRSREFMFIIPSDHDPTRSYPLVFAWYHISGNAQDFVEYIDTQALADEKQMMFVIPQDSGMFKATWPVTPLDNNQASVDLVFFDDLLSCIHAQYSVNLGCVASAGVSAGGLWTAFLGQRRGRHLASNMVFSGGYPTEFGQYWWNWQTSPHRFASLVLWGGPSDELVIDFHQASLNYIDHLEGDGHYIVQCKHDQGHAPPPPDPGETEPPIDAIFDFVLAHPYWYEGDSPYEDEGAPDNMPSYCDLP